MKQITPEEQKAFDTAGTRTTRSMNAMNASDIVGSLDAATIYEVGIEIGATVVKGASKRRNALHIKTVTNKLHHNVNHKSFLSKNNGL